jgi:hypothetical protein
MVTWIIISAQSDKMFEAVVAEYISYFQTYADPVSLRF